MLLQQMEMKRVLMLTKTVGDENVLKDLNNEEPSTKPFDVHSVANEDRNHQKAHKNEEIIVHKSADKNTLK